MWPRGGAERRSGGRAEEGGIFGGDRIGSIPAMIVCPKCRTQNAGSASFCESCGTSLVDLREADDKIEAMLLREARKGVWALGIVAALQVVATLVLDSSNPVLWTIAGVFVALAVWAIRAPLIASAVGLGVFVVLHATEAIVDPTSLFRGILLKIVVIGLLVGAIKTGVAHRNFRRERGLR